MADIESLKALAEQEFAEYDITANIALNELTVDVPKEHIYAVCLKLRDHVEFHCEQLMDLCGVDYSTYGDAEWSTEENTYSGFSRAVEAKKDWSQSKHRYVYTHHVHHKNAKDYAGVTVESLRSPSGTDSWHHRNGYQHAPKAIEGFLHHPNFGQIARLTHIF